MNHQDTKAPRHQALLSWCLCVLVICFLSSCQKPRDPNTVVFLIESHPANLDPRVGTDAQSERINQLLFDALLEHDENFQLRPALA